MANLDIYRNGVVVTSIKISDDTIYSGVLLGENELKVKIETSDIPDIQTGDYVLHKGLKFSLSQSLPVEKKASNDFVLEFVLEGPEYKLYNKLLLHLGNSEFSYYGNLEAFIDLIIDCIGEIDSEFSKGEVEEIDGGKTISFKGDSCRSALTKVCEAFGIEFSFSGTHGKTINAKKSVGSLIPGIQFEYGKGNGLYSLKRLNFVDSKQYTRFYGFGASKNLPPSYRDGLTRLTFEERFIDIREDLEDYEIVETEVFFEDIFPNRKATITATSNFLEITDSTLDFDLNNLVVQGQSKVLFLTGDLAGGEYEIESYNHATKTIKLIAKKDESGYSLPNSVIKPVVGDEYTLIGIEMPSSYITSAEANVKTATEEYVDNLKDATQPYQLDVDEKFIRDNDLIGVIERGDRISIVDSDLNVDAVMRVQSISYPLANPSKLSIVLSDEVVYNRIEVFIKELKSQKETIYVTEKKRYEDVRELSIKHRDNLRITEELSNALDALKAEMLLIMVDGSVFETNIFAAVTEDNFVTTAGSLVNQQYEGTWSVSASSNTLASNVPYYVYVKASKSDSTATIVISATKIAVEEVSGFYHFMFGIISSKVSGTRVFTSTKGYTRIIGNNIQTGRISSVGGQSFFDLDDGTFFMGNENSSVDFGITTPDTLTVKGHIEATSGSIAGVEIDADDLFTLNGTKVNIVPDEGIAVVDDGLVDFSEAQVRIPTVAQTPDTGEAAEWVGNLAGAEEDEPDGGRVVSVGISVPTGLEVSNSPVTNSGVIAISLVSGYEIPLAANVTKGVTAHGWGNHASAGYAVASELANSATITASTTHGAPNTIVRRDASGYTNVSYINYSAGLEPGTVVSMMAKIAGNGDFLYPVSANQIRTFLSVPTNNNELANGAGYITGINSTMVTGALGYTPTNKAGDVMTGGITFYNHGYNSVFVDIQSTERLQKWQYIAYPDVYNLELKLTNPIGGVIDYRYTLRNNGNTYTDFLKFDRGMVYVTKLLPSTLVLPTSTPDVSAGQAAEWVGNLAGAEAAITDTWGGQVYVNEESYTVNGYVLAYTTAGNWKPTTAGAVANWLGLSNYLPKSGGTISGTGNTLYIISDNNSLTLGVGYLVPHGYIGGQGSALYLYSNNGGYAMLNAASALVAASDINRKKDIVPFTVGLDAILELQPKKFRYKSQSFLDPLNVGFIAQEVRDYLPEAYNENGDFIGLDYNAFIPALVNAVKTLNARIVELEGGAGG